MASEITDFVKHKIYPSLNAAEEGFLDGLNPKKSGSAYVVDCPACGQSKKAYYYPYSGYVQCNRQNNCGVHTSVWDCLVDAGYSKFDALKLMADAVGESLPSDDSVSNRSISEIVKSALRYGLEKSQRGMDYILGVRGWREDEVKNAGFGYIHKTEYFLNSLRKQGVSEEILADWGYLEVFEKGEKLGHEYSFDNRIVGWWETPDGKLYLWGRDVTGQRKDKYRYQDGLVKDMPCYWNEKINKENRQSLILVEGPLDASRLMANGIPSVAIGGASISGGMSLFLAERIGSYLHWIDNDVAGHVGAGGSIARTNAFGIYSSVFYSPLDGVKDADEALGKMDADTLISLINEHSVGCGEFLANGFIQALKSETLDLESIYGRARYYYAKLQGVAKTEFFNLMSSSGIMVDNPNASALRALADLLDAGVEESQARRIIRNRFEVNITIGAAQ
jgi:DNA primase